MSKSVKKYNPKISVIVPVYNVERYIPKGIDSLLNQTLDPKFFEVIIIDDCSTDNSLEVCKRTLKGVSNFRVIENQKNIDLGPTRNKGIELAKGEFLYFIDGDDYIDTDALENLLNLAQEHDSDLVTAGYKRVDERENILFEKNDYLNLTDDKFKNLEMMLSDQVTHTAWGKLVKKSLFTDNDIRYPKGIHEDVPVTYLLFWYAERIHVSEKSSYYWLKRPASITSHMSKEHIDGWFNAIDKQRIFVKRNFDSNESEELSKAIEQGFLNAAEVLLENIYKYEGDNIKNRRTLYNHLFNKIQVHGNNGYRRYKKLDKLFKFFSKSNDISDNEVQTFEKIFDNKLIYKY